jgi:hypothetical protein
MAYQIQLRSDTANNWTYVNPTLAQGEAGYETNTGNLKIGDGSTEWANLPYFAGSGGGGNGTPGGSNGTIQFNNNGSFDGNPNFIIDLANSVLSVTGNVNANYFIGDGSLLTNLPAGNYSNTNVQSFLTSGNLVGNIIPSGNAIYSLGNATNQWKDLWISSNTIYIDTIPLSTNSNSDLTFNGNPIVTANAAANGATNVNELSVSGNVSATSANIANTSIANGNVTANYFIGDGSLLTNINYSNIVGAYGDANVANYLSTVSNINLTEVNASGDITTGGVFYGNGAGLTNIPASAIIGAYSNANVANYLPTYTGEFTAGNANVSGEVVAGGNITADYYYGNIAFTTGGYGDSNVAAFLPTYGGDILANTITANNAAFDNNVSIAGNLDVTGNTNYTNVNNLLVDDPLIYAGANNISNIVDQGLITPFNDGTQQYGGFVRDASTGAWKLFANVTDAPNTTVNFANATYVGLQAGWFAGDGGNLSNINAANITGNISLANADVTGSANIGANLSVGGNIISNGNITADYFIGDGSNLSNIQYSSLVGAYGDANVAAYLPTNTSNVAAAFFIGDGSKLSNINYANIPGAYSNSNVAAYLANSNVVINTSNIVSNTANIVTLTGNTANITTITSNSITGNTANLTTLRSNTINANTVTANYFSGDGSNLSNIQYSSIVGAYSNSNVANYLPTYAGIVTASDVTATDTITGDRLTTGNLSMQANIISSVGSNITIDPGNDGLSGGNVIIAGNLQVAGNVTYVNVTTADTDNLVWVAANNASTPSAATGGGLAVGPATNPYATFLYNAAQNIWVSNLSLGVNGGANFSGALTGVTNITANGNITGAYIRGDGSNLSNIQYSNLIGAYSNANVASYLSSNLVSTNVKTSANVQAAFFIGDGGFLTNVSGGGSNYSNANVAAYLPTDSTISVINGNVANTNSNVSNLTDSLANTNSNVTFITNGLANTNSNVSNLANSLANTNSNVATLTTGLANTNSNVSDLSNSISNLQGQVYANSNVAAYLPSYGGDISGVNASFDLMTAVLFSGDGGQISNINAANLVGAYSNANVADYLPTYAGQFTAANVTVTGDVIADLFVGDGGQLSNINVANITGGYANSNVANYLPTYTGIVTASDVNVSDSITVANTVSAANIDTGTGNIQIRGNTISTTTANIILDPGNDGITSGDVYIQGNLQVVGNVTYVDVSIAASDNLVWQAANNAINSSAADGGGLAVGPAGNSYATWLFNNSTNSWNSSINVEVAGDVGVYGDLNALTVVASEFFGDGGGLSNINASNIVGGYSNSNVASYLLTNTSNIQAGNIIAVKNVYADQFIGDGGLLSNIQAGNVVGAYSNSNVASYLLTNTGNISADYYLGNGSQLTGLYSNSNTASYLLTNTGNIKAGNANIVGNINASYFIGNGALLTGLPAGYSNANAASYLLTNTGDINGGNITANYFIGNGSLLTGLPATYANSNVANYLPTYGGDISADYITANSMGLGVGNIQMLGDLIYSTDEFITIDPGANGATNGTLVVAGNLQVTGNITYVDVSVATSDNLIWQAANSATNPGMADGGGLAVGPAGNSYATFLYNSATDVWQSDVTIESASNFVALGNVSGAYIIGDGSLLTGLPAQYANSNVASYLASGNVVTDIITYGNIESNIMISSRAMFALDSIGSNLITGNNCVFANGIINNILNINGNATVTNGMFAGNLHGEGGNISNINGDNIVGGYGNINVATYLANSSTNGDIFGGVITAEDNVLSNAYYIGASGVLAENNGIILAGADGANGTSVGIIAGNANGINSDGGTVALIAGTATGTGNPGLIYLIGETAVSGANLTVTGNITSDGIDANVATVSDLVSSNMIGAVDLVASGNITANGKITAGYFWGDGSNISNINAGNLVGGYGNANVADYLPTYTGDLSPSNITVTTSADLGAIANITITGGNAGEVIITDGAGNLSFGTAINAIPAVYFSAPISGNNQTFSNAVLSAYAANTDITLFYNGVLLENSFYTLSGDTITVNTELNSGDSIDIVQQFTGTFNTIVNNSYGNANVASYLPTYTGDVTAANVSITGLFSAPQRTVTSSSPGSVGQICWDASYIYVCTSANTWSRTQLTSGF